MKISLEEAAGIIKDLEELKNIASSMSRQLTKENDKPLNFKEAADYLRLSHSHLYKLTGRKIIPCHRPLGRLFFYKHELDAWIKSEGQNADEIAQYEDQTDQDDDPP